MSIDPVNILPPEREKTMLIIPPRKAVLFLLDPSTGKLYPVRLELSPDGRSAYLSISIDKDNVGLARESTLRYMAVENGMRAFDITVDDLFAVPSGRVWYVKNLYITSGQLYLDGDLKVI